MKSMVWTLLVILVGVSIVWAADDDSEYQWRKNQEEPGEWTLPDCDRITGSGVVTFTTDEGATLTTTTPIHGTTYTEGLVALEAGNTLLATSMTSAGTSILRSEDAGCSWHQIALIQADGLLLLTAAEEDGAYGWSRGRTAFYFIDGDNVSLRSAPNRIYGLAVDPEDERHIRIGSMDCQLYESFDGGVSFAPLGESGNTGSTIFFTVEFDPSNWDNALCGGIGAWRTADGGGSWDAIVPFDYDDRDLVYVFRYAPGNPDRVWARANLETLGAATREIMISNDGGVTFGPAIIEGDQAVDQNGLTRGAILTNSPTMAAHPELSDVLYFVFGSYFQDIGTSLFRYDAGTDNLTVTHTDGLDGIDAIAFNPGDASVMYLGLEEENVSLAKPSSDASAAQATRLNASPNPFNPVVNIGFSLANAGQVKLEVYNIAGQKMATLVNDHLGAGEHRFSWDGSKAASGVYLYRLETGQFSETKKMVLLK